MKPHPLILLLMTAGLAGCSDQPKTDRPQAAAPHRHEHTPPHGGTPVVLGDEEHHLEIVREAGTGKLTAFVLDGHLEQFIRITAPSFTLEVAAPRATLTFRAVTNSASGETFGDTAQFEAQADWLKTTPAFDAVLPSLSVRAKTYTNVAFNFPKGNETGEEGRP